jgi:hypothetical protein
LYPRFLTTKSFSLWMHVRRTGAADQGHYGWANLPRSTSSSLPREAGVGLRTPPSCGRARPKRRRAVARALLVVCVALAVLLAVFSARGRYVEPPIRVLAFCEQQELSAPHMPREEEEGLAHPADTSRTDHDCVEAAPHRNLNAERQGYTLHCGPTAATRVAMPATWHCPSALHHPCRRCSLCTRPQSEPGVLLG